MSALGTIFKAADLVLAGLQVADRIYTAGRKLFRRAKPKPPVQPWTYQDVKHVNDMSRSGAENWRSTTEIRRKPPPLKR